MTQKRAVVLLSGGLDSTTILKLAQNQEYEIYALTFMYGQRHSMEVDAATKIAKKCSVKKHKIAEIDLKIFGGSSLTDSSITVPKNSETKTITYSHEVDNIPNTYVPARNTIFLSYALGYAETIKAEAIFIGINALDYSGYPDCRPEYLEKFNELAKIATAVGISGEVIVQIKAPLLHLSKQEIIKLGIENGVNYSDTTSCYDPSEDGKACGLCDACILRKQGFAMNEMIDPIEYQ